MTVPQEQYAYVPDERDYKILDVIADNGRLPHLRISKLTGISKDSIRERLHNLQKERFILSYVPLIDYSFIGYKLFHAYVEINPVHNTEVVINSLKTDPNISSITFTFGKYDLELQILARNKAEVMKIISNHINTNKTNLCVLSPGEFDIYSMKLTKPQVFENKRGRYILDELDVCLLNELSRDSRTNIVTLAKNSNSSVEVVRYRLRMLTKRGVILGFHARTNKHKFGLSTYILLMNLKNPTKVKRVFDLPNIYYARNFSLRFNYILGFHTRNNSQLAKTINRIRQSLGSDLLSFDLLILLDRKKFEPMPENFLKKLKNP